MKLIRTLFLILTVAVVAFAGQEADELKHPAPQAVSSVTAPNALSQLANAAYAAGQPFRCHVSVAPNGGMYNFNICNVPAGFRFAIDQISSMAVTSNSSRLDYLWIGTTFGGKQEVDFVPYAQKAVGQYSTRHQALHTVAMYADGGTTIKASMAGSLNWQTDGVWLTLTGRLVAQ